MDMADISKPNPNSWPEALRFFPGDIRNLLARVPEEASRDIIEIRIRVHQPLELITRTRMVWLSARGELENNIRAAYRITPEDLKKIINAMTTGSFYAIEEEIAEGYLALPGGHRVGFAGQVLHQNGKIRLIRNISSLNFRIARTCMGIARPLLPFLWKDGRFYKTLILSPPACGKTTLLREIIREVSCGIPGLNIPGIRVGVADERSEIAGSYHGVPQLDVGCRTDVLDGCPKKEGVYLLLRSMNPQLIATDEVGREEDCKILEDIVNAGVSFIATAHALNLTEAVCRPGLRKILEGGMIERLIFLSNRRGAGTLESVKAGVAGPELFSTVKEKHDV